MVGIEINDVALNIIIILAIFIPLWKIIDYILAKMFKKKTEIHWRFLGNILKTVLVIVCLALIGSQFEVTSKISVELFKSTGLFVAVIGFAAQEVLKDVLAGMVISWSKPYNIGSRINLESLKLVGIVEDITLRHTIIKCYDNSRVIVPNSIINRDILRNSDYDDSLIGNYIEIGVDYTSDVRLASAILQSVVLSEELVLDASKGNSEKKCFVQVKEITSNAVVLKTTVWTKNVDDNFLACSSIRLRVKEAFDKAGIVIPYDCVTIYKGDNTNYNETGRE